MGEKKAREIRRRRRLRRKRRVWFVVIVLLFCMIASVFSAGFLVGCSWRKNIRRETDAENFAVSSNTASGTWENTVRSDMDGNAAEYRAKQDEAAGDKDFIYTNDADTEWNLLLVNKWNPVPGEYEVSLVDVEGGESVDERIYGPLMEMLEDAKEANWEQVPRVVSGYRTTEKQQQLYDEKLAEYRRMGYSGMEAEELAEQWVAVPGYSEHQLGLAVDINGATYDVYFWLQENSYKYGFIFRYPGHKTELTGVAEEVWHYRYVGVEAAAEIYEQGICLEEYIERMGKM